MFGGECKTPATHRERDREQGSPANTPSELVSVLTKVEAHRSNTQTSAALAYTGCALTETKIKLQPLLGLPWWPRG